MFNNNKMFDKNDPLINSVTKIMQENNVRRAVEKAVNEELGIYNKKELPFQMFAAYDALTEEVVQEALKGDQHKIDVNKNGRLDKQDFKMLKGKKVEENMEKPCSSKPAMEEEKIDEVAPPGSKYERMVKHIKKGYAKDGELSKKEKSIAYATAWKRKNQEGSK